MQEKLGHSKGSHLYIPVYLKYGTHGTNRPTVQNSGFWADKFPMYYWESNYYFKNPIAHTEAWKV
jgi:hypothetical protein